MKPRGADTRAALWARYASETTSAGVPMYDAMLELQTTSRAWATFLDHVPRGRRGTAADYGCGTGAVTKALLLGNPDARVVAIDREEGFLDRAQSALGHQSNVEFRRGDIAGRLPLDDGEVDAFGTHNFVFPYLTTEEQRAFVRELARVHAPGSLLIGSTMLRPFTFRDVVISNLGAELRNPRAMWIGLRELVPRVTSQFDEQMRGGWMCYPSLDELRALHEAEGFTSFEVVAPIMPLRHLVRLWRGASHAAVVFRAVRVG